ncbi:recombinase family protein [Chloroflexi bacterium TSY]|nr:recombinase family protein [Chloroflexi bacterium TSY]
MSDLQVALYARVSSDQQAEAGTVASQISALQERIEQDRLVLAAELTFIDDGYSGATLIRPALEQLRDVVALQGIDRVYVHSPDRLARKYAYQVLLLDEFQRAGVELVFLNRELGQSPEDDLLLQVQGMMAEYERAKILERHRRGKLHAARTGNVAVLSGAPYGYLYVSKQDGGGQARYEIILDEARVVRQVFHWVGHERVSIGEVARRLQAAGERTRSGKTTWDRTTIQGMLRNPAYKGQAAFGKTKTEPMRPKLRPQRGDPAIPKRPVSTVNVPQEEWLYIPVPPLVSEALFDTVQEQLEENRRRARQRKRGASYLLQGLLVCADCGYSFYGKPVSRKSAKGKTRRYAYYRCIGTDAYRFGGERICHNLQVRTDLLENMVWDEVCALLNDTARVEREYQRRLQAPAKDNDDLDVTNRQLAKIKQSIARLIDTYTDGFIDKDEFAPRIRRLRQRQSDLEEKLQKLNQELSQQQQLRLLITQLEDFAAKVTEGLDTADWQTKREIIRMLVQRIEIAQDDVNVVFRIPSSPFELSPERGGLQHCSNCNLPSGGQSGSRWVGNASLSNLFKSTWLTDSFDKVR